MHACVHACMQMRMAGTCQPALASSALLAALRVLWRRRPRRPRRRRRRQRARLRLHDKRADLGGLGHAAPGIARQARQRRWRWVDGRVGEVWGVGGGGVGERGVTLNVGMLHQLQRLACQLGSAPTGYLASAQHPHWRQNGSCQPALTASAPSPGCFPQAGWGAPVGMAGPAGDPGPQNDNTCTTNCNRASNGAMGRGGATVSRRRCDIPPRGCPDGAGWLEGGSLSSPPPPSACRMQGRTGATPGATPQLTPILTLTTVTPSWVTSNGCCHAWPTSPQRRQAAAAAAAAAPAAAPGAAAAAALPWSADGKPGRALPSTAPPWVPRVTPGRRRGRAMCCRAGR